MRGNEATAEGRAGYVGGELAAPRVTSDLGVWEAPVAGANTGIGPWTVGKHLTQFSIAPVVVAAAATITSGGTTWTTGTPVDCAGTVRRMQHQVRIQTSDIRPITNPQENQVPVSYGNTMQIVNLRLANNTTPGNSLSDMLTKGFYVEVLFNDSLEQFDGFYVITGYDSGFDGNAEQIQTLDLGPVAIPTGGQTTRAFIAMPTTVLPPPP